MKKLKLFIIAFLITLSSYSIGAIKTIMHPKIISVAQWEVVDITFQLKKTPENPFATEFGAIFANAENKLIKVPGFYNGGQEWVVRFSNSDQGKWTYTTYSSVVKLNGLKGELTVTKNTNKNKHGAIIINKEKPQHFSYEDGTPYMTMAFECDWLFALDYENKEDAPKSKHLLDLIQKNGLNQIVTTVYSYDVSWPKDEKLKLHPEHEFGGKLNIFPFLGTNERPDYSALNVEFFKQFDRTIALMNDREIVTHLMIYVWNKGVKWPDTESEPDNMYFDYIIKRYQAFPNIIWDVSNEALNNARCTEAYGVERIQRIQRNDAFKRLISVHDYGFCIRNTQHVDFISTQNWSSTLYTKMLDIRNKYTNRPIFNIEHGGYERSFYDVFPGDYSSPEVCLRRNYFCSFAGVYNTYYWQGVAWNVMIYNPFELRDEFPKPKFEYYKHLTDFFKKYPFSEFEPDPDNNRSGYCLTNNKGTYLMYIPKENEELSVYGNNPMNKSTGTVQWFNTLTGEYSKETEHTGEFFTSPWKGEADAILIRKIAEQESSGILHFQLQTLTLLSWEMTNFILQINRNNLTMYYFKFGISSWSYPWSVGVAKGPQPLNKMTALDILKKAKALNIGLENTEAFKAQEYADLP